MAALKLWGTSTFKNFSKEVNHQLYTPVNHGHKGEMKKQNDSHHNKRYEHHTQLKSGQAETSHQGGTSVQVGMSKEDAEAALFSIWEYVRHCTADTTPSHPHVSTETISINPIQKVIDWLERVKMERGY